LIAAFFLVSVFRILGLYRDSEVEPAFTPTHADNFLKNSVITGWQHVCIFSFEMQIGVAMRSILFALVIVCIVLTPAAFGQATKPAVSRAYGDGEFRLGPDDVIEVSVYQDKELDRTVPVRPDGKISLPLIGEMAASGKTPTELQKEIAQKLKQFVAEPNITVVVKEVNSPKVSVIGEVKNPNMYKIKDKATLLDAIALAGGLTEYSKKKVVISRVGPNGQTEFIRLNIDDLMKGKKPDPFYVLPYDKIVIQ
jgi:polysaccharide export outer membrane protein